MASLTYIFDFFILIVHLDCHLLSDNAITITLDFLLNARN